MSTLGDIARVTNATPVLPLVSAFKGGESSARPTKAEKKRKLEARSLRDLLNAEEPDDGQGPAPSHNQGRSLRDLLNAEDNSPRLGDILLAEDSAPGSARSTLAFARNPLSSIKAFKGILPTLESEFTGGIEDVRRGVGVPSSAGVWEDLKGQGKAGLGAARAFFSPVTALVKPLVSKPAGALARASGASEKAAGWTELGAEITGNLLFPGVGLLRLPGSSRKLGDIARASSGGQPRASTAGAAQVEGADVGLASKPPIGERALDVGKAALRGISPLVGGRSIRYLDEPAKYSPTLKAMRDEIEHPQGFELLPGQIAGPDFTEKVLRTTGNFMSRINSAISPLRSRQGFLSGEARGKLAADIRLAGSGRGAGTPAYKPPGGPNLIHLTGPGGNTMVLAVKKGAAGASGFDPLAAGKADLHNLQADKLTGRLGSDRWIEELGRQGYSPDEVIGFTHFVDRNKKLTPAMTFVSEEFRRRGVASSMYDVARSKTASSLISGSQRPEGKLFRQSYDKRTPPVIKSPSAVDQVQVRINTSAFDEGFKRDGAYYVGQGGKSESGVSGRYRGFEEYLKTGKPIEMPQVHVDDNGVVSFTDGRHRYAVMRDRGLPVEVTMDQESARNAVKFGYASDRGSAKLGVGAGAEIRKILDDVHLYAKEAGLDVPYRAGYLPRVYNEYLRSEAGAQQWGHVLKKYGIDFDDAERYRQKIIDDDFVDIGAISKGVGAASGVGKPSWMKHRGLGHIPDEALAPFLHNDPRSVLAKYVPSVVKHAEHARLFGPAGEKLEATIPKIREELGQAGRRFSPKEESQLRGISAALVGKYKPIESAGLAKANRLMMSYQFVRTLPKAVLSSLSEPFIALETGSAKGFSKAILPSIGYAGNSIARSIFPTIKKGEEGRMLDELGLTTDSSLRDILSEGLPRWLGGLKGTRGGDQGQLLGEAADTSSLPAGRGLQAYFKLNLLEPWTKFTRVVGYNSAKYSMLDALKKGKTKGFREFGIDPEQAAGWYSRVGSAKSPLEAPDPYQKAMQNGVLRFINESVMMPRPATKPLWMSDPHWALIGQLKSYQGNFGNTVGRRWFEQTKNTFRSDEDMAKTAKMVGAAGLMTMTAVLANEFREYLSYGKGGDPKFKNEKPGKKVLRAMDRAGFSGGLQPGVDAVWGQRFGTPGLMQLLGPAVTQTEGVLKGVQDLAKKGDPKALQFQAISAVPGYNVLPSKKKRTLREALVR